MPPPDGQYIGSAGIAPDAVVRLRALNAGARSRELRAALPELSESDAWTLANRLLAATWPRRHDIDRRRCLTCRRIGECHVHRVGRIVEEHIRRAVEKRTHEQGI